MIDYTIFIDMHGVLVDSHKMIKNYENILIEKFKKYNISKEEAIRYHLKGLKLYTTLLNEIKDKKLTGKNFLEEMDVADKKWDYLLQSFTKVTAHDLESRNIEFLAGSSSDSFYDDGKTFLRELDNLAINYYIVSNSHSKHMEGLFKGAGFENIDNNKLLGWDKIESLKNTDYYYKRLDKMLLSKEKIIIGNSKQEMVLGKKIGFSTIFVDREFQGKNDFIGSIDVTVENLMNLANLIYERFSLNGQ